MPHTSQGLQSVAKKAFSTCPKITTRGHNICLNFVIRSKDYPSVVWNVCPYAPKDMSNGKGITCWIFFQIILPLLLFSLLAMGSLWLVHHYLLPLLYYMGPTCTFHVWYPHNPMVLECNQVYFLSCFSFFGFYMFVFFCNGGSFFFMCIVLLFPLYSKYYSSNYAWCQNPFVYNHVG